MYMRMTMAEPEKQTFFMTLYSYQQVPWVSRPQRASRFQTPRVFVWTLNVGTLER